jgi:hypothetical protein
LGQLARWTLTGGQAHDLTQAQTLIEGIATGAVVADKAFDHRTCRVLHLACVNVNTP